MKLVGENQQGLPWFEGHIQVVEMHVTFGAEVHCQHKAVVEAVLQGMLLQFVFAGAQEQ